MIGIMDRLHSMTWIAALALVATGCTASTAPEPFPQATADAAAERFAAHDSAGVASFYTADALLMPPDQEVVTGRAADGTIEAVELADHEFVLGVQWHPEQDDLRLFSALTSAALISARMSGPSS